MKTVKRRKGLFWFTVEGNSPEEAPGHKVFSIRDQRAKIRCCCSVPFLLCTNQDPSHGNAATHNGQDFPTSINVIKIILISL